jgi:hypothetical protein
MQLIIQRALSRPVCWRPALLGTPSSIEKRPSLCRVGEIGGQISHESW